MSSSSPKNLEIERLRAVAILLVLNAHAPYLRTVLPPLLTGSWTGVDLFFVISGFVVSQSFLRSLPPYLAGSPWRQWFRQTKTPLISFYLRRVFRIFPAAILWMGCYIGLAAYFQEHNSGTTRQLLIESAFVLSGAYNYINACWHTFEVYYLGHYWSLTVEEHFYLIAPWLLLLFPTRRGRILTVLASLALIIFVVRPFVPLFGPKPLEWSFLIFTSHRRFDALFLGVLLGILRLGTTKSGRASFAGRLAMTVPVVGLIYAIASYPLWAPDPFRVNLGLTLVASFGAVLVWLASFERGYILDVPGLRQVLDYIGARSYSMYLAHIAALIVMLHYTDKFRPQLPEWWLNGHLGNSLQFVLFTVITIIVSDISYRLIERPMVSFGKNYIAQRTRSANEKDFGAKMQS